MIATEFVKNSVIAAIKLRHKEVMVITVDLFEPIDVCNQRSKITEIAIKDFVQRLFVRSAGTRLFYEHFDDLYNALGHGGFSTKYDYLVVIVKNWEAFYAKYPDGIIERFAILSYWHNYLRQIFAGRKSILVSSNDVNYFENLDDWRSNYFIILSHNQKTL